MELVFNLHEVNTVLPDRYSLEDIAPPIVLADWAYHKSEVQGLIEQIRTNTKEFRLT